MKKMSEDAKKIRKEKMEQKKITENLQKEEERILQCLESELKDLRAMPLPNPKYKYSILETVSPRRAHWDSIEVLDILDEGKILKCKIKTIEKGNEVFKIRYLSHLDIIPKTLNLSQRRLAVSNDKRQISFSNGEIGSLLVKHYRFLINYEPIYQRELCWSLEDKRNLIKSIFLGVEIGKFAFCHLPYAPNSPGYEILDGKQRLTTLVEFYEDKFTYEGLYFSELSNSDKYYWESYNVTSGCADESWTLPDKLEYFLRLNVSGVPQSQEHLNKINQMLMEVKK